MDFENGKLREVPRITLIDANGFCGLKVTWAGNPILVGSFLGARHL